MHTSRTLTLSLLLVAGCDQSLAPLSMAEPTLGEFPRLARVTPEEARHVEPSAVVAVYESFAVVRVAPSQTSPVFELHPEWDEVLLNVGAIDVQSPEGQALDVLTALTEPSQLFLVHFPGPISPTMYEHLVGTGARIVTYVPSNTYLVWADERALAGLVELRQSGKVSWASHYLPRFRFDASVPSRGDSWDVQLVQDAANERTLAWLRTQGQVQVAGELLGYLNLVVQAPRETVLELTMRSDVVSVHHRPGFALTDERQAQVCAGQVSSTLQATGPGYLAWLSGRGFSQAAFSTSSFGVDVTDTGLDNGTIAPNQFALYQLGAVNNLAASRVAYVRAEGTPNVGGTTQGCFLHADLVTSVLAGYSNLAAPPHVDGSGFASGLGVAPFVKVGNSVIFDPEFTSPNYANLQARAWRDTMRISNNSWSAEPTDTAASQYTFHSQAYDALVRDAQLSTSDVPAPGNQEMTIVFAAGNSGLGAPVLMPANAKNVLTVGSSQDSSLSAFSSRGPTADGRGKPELLAPGEGVTGALPQAASQRRSPAPAPLGLVLPCAAGRVGTAALPGQQWYQRASGTSFAAPAVSGAAALVRQWFITQGRPAPSPAMVKALLTNSARMLNVSALDRRGVGHGVVDVGAALDGTRLLEDQSVDRTFTATGQTRSFDVMVVDPSKPVKVTLAWTDAPGATLAAAWKNDLDLTVQAGPLTYRGAFSGAASVAGAARDSKNNLEAVVLPLPSARLTVTITAANLNSDGVPGNAAPLDQDYALVISNATVAPAARSCLGYLGRPSGVYDVDPDGAGPGAAFPVYCDLVNDNGGWMLVSNLYHPSPGGLVTSQTFGVPTLTNTNVVLENGQWALIKQHLLGGPMSLRINGAVDAQRGNLFANKAIFTRAQLTSASCGNLLGLSSLSLGVLLHHENSGCSASGLDYTWVGPQPGFWSLSTLLPSVCTGDCVAPYAFENLTTAWVREEPAVLPLSCKDLVTPSSTAYRPGAPSGVYTIDPDGNGPGQAFPVYCDLVNNGGGWMLLSTLYHPSPGGLVTSQSIGVPTPTTHNTVLSDSSWAIIKQHLASSPAFTLRVNGALEAEQARLFTNYALFNRATLVGASCDHLLNRTSLVLALVFHDESAGCNAVGLDYTWFGQQPGFWSLSTRKPDVCVGDCAKLTKGVQYAFENYLSYWVRE